MKTIKLFFLIIMGGGFIAGISSAPAFGHDQEAVSKVQNFQARETKFEDMISTYMDSGMDFQSSYVAAKQEWARVHNEPVGEIPAVIQLAKADEPVYQVPTASIENKQADLAENYKHQRMQSAKTYESPRSYEIAQADAYRPAPIVPMTGVDQPIKTQTFNDITGRFQFYEDYREATEHDLSDSRNPMPSKRGFSNNANENQIVILTPEAIINQTIKPEYRSTKIDLDFDQATLSDLFMTLGQTGNINIVVDPLVAQNKLDLHLKQVTLQESLLLIANMFNLGYDKIGDSLFVTSKEKLNDRQLQSKVIKLTNVSVEEAKKMIDNLVDQVNVSDELNSLVVTGMPEQILKAEAMIKQIDNAQAQVIIEAKIIEINKDALKDIGVDWSDQVRLGYQENGRNVDFDNKEISNGDQTFEINSIARNPVQFETVIHMLENQNKAKVLSNPRVTTLNNKEAEIFVGDRIPYTVTNVTGGVATTDVRFVEPGIRLGITPSIIDDDFVVLQVKPEVSFIFAFRGPNDEFPHVKTREATAYVRIKNRTPFVIGGLLNQEDKQNLFKVPVLGNIPLLGNLFSYEKHSVLDTELIITVLPTVVSGNM